MRIKDYDTVVSVGYFIKENPVLSLDLDKLKPIKHYIIRVFVDENGSKGKEITQDVTIKLVQEEKNEKYNLLLVKKIFGYILFQKATGFFQNYFIDGSSYFPIKTEDYPLKIENPLKLPTDTTLKFIIDSSKKIKRSDKTTIEFPKEIVIEVQNLEDILI